MNTSHQTALSVAFLGFGKMAQAIASGWQSHQSLVQVYAYAPHQDKLQASCTQFGAIPCASAAEAVDQAQVVILACKPGQVPSVLEEVKAHLADRWVICLAAGINNDKLQALIPQTAHVSIMPNVAVAVGEGTVIVEAENTLNKKQLETLKALFAPLALVEVVDGAHFGIAGVICGCSPAFLGLYAEALADAGVKYGLSRAVAAKLSAQAIAGAGSLLSSGKEPAVFKNEICSPGGTTIKGIVALEKAGFRKAVIEAVEAIQEGK